MGSSYLFMYYFWLHWVFIAAHGLSLVVVCKLLIAVASLVAVPSLLSTGSLVVADGLSCSRACGIFPDQGSNLHLLHWQMDSLPLSHQENPGGISEEASSPSLQNSFTLLEYKLRPSGLVREEQMLPLTDNYGIPALRRKASLLFPLRWPLA